MVARLESAGIPYMLTGSFASAYHGRPRATQDIDFVIAPSPDQIRALIHALPPTEYHADEATALEAHRQESRRSATCSTEHSWPDKCVPAN